MPEWSIGMVCKTIGASLRRFESSSQHNEKNMTDVQKIHPEGSGPELESRVQAFADAIGIYPEMVRVPKNGALTLAPREGGVLTNHHRNYYFRG